MPVRHTAWLTHTLITFVLLTVTATWAFQFAEDSIARALAFMGFACVVLYAILATGIVAAWGRRPLHVVGIHVACMAVATLLVMTFLVGR
jgi:hypothetical protein